MLNCQQVKDLFDKESILISSENVVPLYRVRELFGDNAVCFSRNVAKSGFNMYGIGDFQLPYATLTGFQIAATYKNIDEIREKMGNLGGYECVEAAQDTLIPEYALVLVDDLRGKYPNHFSSWDIICETLEKAVDAENRRKNRKKSEQASKRP